MLFRFTMTLCVLCLLAISVFAGNAGYDAFGEPCSYVAFSPTPTAKAACSDACVCGCVEGSECDCNRKPVRIEVAAVSQDRCPGGVCPAPSANYSAPAASAYSPSMPSFVPGMPSFQPAYVTGPQYTYQPVTYSQPAYHQPAYYSAPVSYGGCASGSCGVSSYTGRSVRLGGFRGGCAGGRCR